MDERGLVSGRRWRVAAAERTTIAPLHRRRPGRLPLAWWPRAGQIAGWGIRRCAARVCV